MFEKVETGDGSVTFFNPEFGEIYHSKSGAEEEAVKKFTEPCNVALRAKSGKLKILDICFGLGYNTAAAIDAALESNPDCCVEVVALENDLNIIRMMKEVNPNFSCYDFLKGLSDLEGDKTKYEITTNNNKIKLVIDDARQSIKKLEKEFDVVFLDPFSPKACPELWTEEFFKDIRKLIKENGVLATFSCARMVRDNLQKAGFAIEDITPVGRRAPGTLARPINA